MKKFDIAILGATGLVGQKMIQILEERQFPVNRLIPIASERSKGRQIEFNGSKIDVSVLNPEIFLEADVALFSAGCALSREIAPIEVNAGAIVIDNSKAWRMERDVPLVVPEINASELHNHNGIIANPDCSTIQLVMVIAPLHKKYIIKRIVVPTYQAVSGSGQNAVKQLEDEIKTGKSEHPAYPHPIAFNCLPHIDNFEDDGYTVEEHKLTRETQKILSNDSIRVTATTVRIPVIAGHSESVNIEFEKEFSLEDISSLLENTPGVSLPNRSKENIYPMPIKAQNRDEVFVGGIRRDPTIPAGLNMWIVIDNLRKGAATNAVQIAEKLVELGKI